jgi:hypothetical protein
MERFHMRGDGTWARFLNALLGAWLFISTFAWRHGQSAGTNTWICGLLILAFAVWALWIPNMRWWNTFLGAWMIFAGIVFPHLSPGTQWNNIIVGAVVLLVSLVPNRALPDRREVAGDRWKESAHSTGAP